jgi:hypothetical protein
MSFGAFHKRDKGMSVGTRESGHNRVLYGRGTIVRECPRCHGPAYRVRRRLIDRLISLIFPRHRYRCESWECRWEGTLRVERL